jgi:hypothetical protein
MNWEILPIEQRHIPSYRETVDAVARERKFLALLEARPLPETEQFVLNHIGRGNPLFVVSAGSRSSAGAILRGKITETFTRIAVCSESVSCHIFVGEGLDGG